MTIINSSKTFRSPLPGAAGKLPVNGIGKITVTDTGTFLKTANETIPVSSSATTALQNGQHVRYTVAGDTLQITPLGESPAHQSGIPTELLTLSEMDGAPASQPSHSSSVTFTVTGPEPGIYLFSSIEELQQATEAVLDPETLKQLKSQISTEGTIALLITTGNDGTLSARSWPVEDIPFVLAQLTGSFSESFFSSLTSDVLRQVLFDREALPFEPLLQLDKLFRSVDIVLPELRAGSADAQKQALLQWLHTALATDLTSAGNVALAPVTPAGTMLADLEPVLALFSELNAAPTPSINSYALTEPDGVSPSPSASLIAQTTDRMGFTLENTLAAATGGTRISPQQSLKSLLQYLLHSLTGNASPSVESPATSPAHIKETLSTGTLVEPAPVLSGEQSGKLADTLVRLKERFSAVVTPRQTGNQPALDAATVTPPPAEDRHETGIMVPRNSTDVSSPQPSGNNAPPVSSLAVGNLLDEALPLLNRYIDQSDTVRAAASTPPAVNTAIQLRDLLTTIVEALSSQKSPDATTPQPASGNLQDTVSAFPEQLRTLVHRALDGINGMLKHLQSLPAERDPSSGTHNESLPRERTLPSDSKPADPLPESLLRSPSSLARALSTALDRLESLQLLARQVPTTQGTQQIIALPIRFGETWSEINVRFLHRKKKHRSEKGNGQFAVAIDVAPPALGGLSAQMHYHPSRELNMKIEFERGATRKWFVNHHDELQQALLDTGMKSVRIDLQPKHPSRSSAARHSSQSDDTLIDMKV